MRLHIHRKDRTPIRMDDPTIRISCKDPNTANLIIYNPGTLVILREVPTTTTSDHEMDKDTID